MEIVTGCASSIARDLVCGAVNQLRYPRSFNNFVEDLQKKKDELITIKNSVRVRVDDDKKQARETAEVVDKWLEDAETDIRNVEELLEKATKNKTCCLRHCPDWIWRYRLAKKLAKKNEDIGTCIQEGRQYIRLERQASLQNTIDLHSEKYVKFESRHSAFEQLMEALRDENVNKIGLYGMGGCGKTTMAHELEKTVLAEQLFKKVLFVAVSSTVDVRKIQDKIASALSFPFPECETEETERARRLYDRLTKEESILVILDDVWEFLDFGVIGIPVSHKGCKILITTRKLNVCTVMDCNRKIPLSILENEEAWLLFQKHANIHECTSNSLKDLARRISDECKGLPVAVAAVASTLKGKPDYTWEAALHRLKSSIPVNIEQGLENPYKCLQLSYGNLDFEEAKSLFLLCSVFPEDYEIPVEDLIRFAIGLGLVGEFPSYEVARNEVSTAIDKLISSSLLSGDVEREWVKMHDLVRDVALWIAKNDKKMIKCIMEEDAMGEHDSLRYLWCEKFSNELDCSNLEFLRIHTNFEVSGEIFTGMGKLRVLFLSWKGWQRGLLSSMLLKSLTNLRCLTLVNWELDDMSFVGYMKKLESLALVYCSFLELPDVVVTQLVNLRLLALLRCEMEKNPLEVIGRHRRLEELYFTGFTVNEFFEKFRAPQALRRYQIHSGHHSEYQYNNSNYHRTLCLQDLNTSNEAVINLVKKAEVLHTVGFGSGVKNIIPDICQMEVACMNDLVELGISSSDQIECLVDISNHLQEVGTVFCKLRRLKIDHMMHLRALFTTTVAQNLIQLEKLDISYCDDLKYIVADDHIGKISREDNKLGLSKLKQFNVEHCRQLTYLFTPVVAQNLIQLEELHISVCHDLKHIVVPDDHIGKISREANKLGLSKLKQLNVEHCRQLTYLFTLVVARNLVQLEELRISFCEDFKHIVANDDIEEINRDDHRLVFLKLKRLNVNNCKELTCLFTPVVARSLVQLEGLNISSSCKKLKHIAADDNKKLKHIVADDDSEDISISYTSYSSSKSGPFNLCNLKRLTVERCPMLRSVFPPSIAKSLTSLEELSIGYCDELRYIVTCDRVHENSEGDIIHEDHDSQSYVSVFSRLKRIFVRDCYLLEYLFPVSLAKGQVELKLIDIRHTPQLRYVFGQSIRDVHSSHQDQNKIEQILLPVLENVSLVGISLISICPDNYYVTCSSLRQLDLILWGNSSITGIWNSSNIQGFFHLEGSPTNGRQVITSRLMDLKLEGLQELSYIWKGAKHSVSLQHLYELEICGCPKLKVIFSTSVLRSLPLLKFLVVEECDELEQIIEKDEENEIAANLQCPDICFSRLKLLVVTKCDNLKRLLCISRRYEFPELQCLMVAENSRLEEVFEVEQGIREGTEEVSLPQLKFVILRKLPNLNNVCQGIELQARTNLLVHNCPNLSLTSTTEAADMRTYHFDDQEIDNLVRTQYCFNNSLKWNSSEDQSSPESELPSEFELPSEDQSSISDEHNQIESATTESHEFLTPQIENKETGNILTSLELKLSLFPSSNLTENTEETETTFIGKVSQSVVPTLPASCSGQCLATPIELNLATSTAEAADILKNNFDDKEIDNLFRHEYFRYNFLKSSSKSELPLLCDKPRSVHEHNQIESAATESHEFLTPQIENKETGNILTSLELKLSLIPSSNLTENIDETETNFIGKVPQSVVPTLPASCSEQSAATPIELNLATSTSIETPLHKTPSPDTVTEIVHEEYTTEDFEQDDKLNESDTRTSPCQNIHNEVDSIQKGSNLTDKGEIGIVSNVNIKITPDLEINRLYRGKLFNEVEEGIEDVRVESVSSHINEESQKEFVEVPDSLITAVASERDLKLIVRPSPSPLDVPPRKAHLRELVDGQSMSDPCLMNQQKSLGETGSIIETPKSIKKYAKEGTTSIHGMTVTLSTHSESASSQSSPFTPQTVERENRGTPHLQSLELEKKLPAIPSPNLIESIEETEMGISGEVPASVKPTLPTSGSELRTTSRSTEDIAKESIQEGPTSEEATKAKS